MNVLGQTSSQTNAQPTGNRRQRRLDLIASAADDVGTLIAHVDGIIGRFTPLPTSDGASAAFPVVAGYTNDLDRLQGNIERLAKAIEQLEEFA